MAGVVVPQSHFKRQATKRVMRDLAEVFNEPPDPSVVIFPVHDNIFTYV